MKLLLALVVLAGGVGCNEVVCSPGAGEACPSGVANCGDAWVLGTSIPDMRSRVTVMARTSDGGAVIAGNFASTIDLGAGPLTTSIRSNFFVAKLDCSGHTQWSKSFPISSHNVEAWGDPDVFAIAERTDGVIVLGGRLLGGLESLFKDVDPVQGIVAGFVLALDANGDKLWVRHYQVQNGSIGVTSLAVGPSGELYATGIGAAGRDLGNVTGNGDPKAMYGFLTKLDEQGEVVWSKKLGDGLSSWFHARVSAKGSLFVCGGADAPPDFGGGALPEGQLLGCAELDAQGSARWTKGFPSQDAAFTDFALQGERLRLVGLGTSLDLGSVKVLGTKHPQAFQVALDAPGTVVKASAFGGSATIGRPSIAVDADGNATAAITIKDGIVGVPGGKIEAGATPSSFLLRLDASTPETMKPTPIGDSTSVYSLVEADTGFLVAGSHQGTVTSGGSSLPATPNWSLFVEHLLN